MKTFLIACAGVFAFAGMAGAQQLTTQHLAVIDANGDGAVDATEFAAFTDKAFKALDVNNDGSISKEEAGTMISAELFAVTDTNGNGAISRAEFSAQTQADFAGLDKDGNGAIN